MESTVPTPLPLRRAVDTLAAVFRPQDFRRTALRSAACVLAIAGCAPDESIPAELDDVCGAPSPFRVLELDPDRTLSFVGQSAFVEQRRVLQIGYLDERQDDSYPATESSEIWSIGECGETPIRLETDATLGFGYEAWPDVLLGCRWDSGEVVTIDPLGERPSNVVFRLEDCRGERTPWGVVAIQRHDDDTGALVLLPYPEDPWTQTASPQVLIDPIRIHAVPEPHAMPGYTEVLAVFDDELFALTTDDALVHLSLLDGSLTTEATNVREFEVSHDRRWVVWQDAALTETEDPEWPEGAIFLRDRTSGTTTHLADTALAHTFLSPFDFLEEGFVRLYLGGFGTQPQRVFSTSGAASFDIAPGHRLDYRLAPGRWIDAGLWGYGPFRVFDFDTRAFEPLFDDEGRARYEDGRLSILQASSHALLNDGMSIDGRLWSVGLDGEHELLAHRVSDSYRLLSDGRVTTVLDPDRRWRSDLVVVEPGSLDEQIVDTHVAPAPFAIDDGLTMLYGVSDHERTGVWLARLDSQE